MQIDEKTIKAAESVLAKGDRVELIPVKFADFIQIGFPTGLISGSVGHGNDLKSLTGKGTT